MRTKFRTLALGLLAVFAASAAQAQEYPSKTVKIIVPYTPGGGTDTMARVVANGLQKALGQSFIVENRPGASGNIGLEQVAKAPADGYTLIMMPSNLSINPPLFGKVNYDSIKDFAPIALVGSSPVAISVSSSTQFQNLADVIRYAKANPGKLSYASCGSGTPQHLAAEQLAQMAKIQIVHVSYKGCSQALPDHLSGTVPIAFSTIANLSQHIKSGKLRGIAVTGSQRSSYAPDMPTVNEAAGLQGYNIDVWFGILAPAGTPKPVIAKLNGIVNSLLSAPEVKQRMNEQLYEGIGGAPEAFTDVIKRDLVRYEKIIREANIKAD
jgi:tripartite-type tricarboxylate transporter receptor subunit TctC